MAEESQEAASSTEQLLKDRTSTMRSSQERFDSLARGLATKRLSRGQAAVQHSRSRRKRIQEDLVTTDNRFDQAPPTHTSLGASS